jgi:hypothetical protein
LDNAAQAAETATRTSRVLLARMLGPAVVYVVFWASVWLVQMAWEPTWLVGSRTGLQTLLQALPATVVALFALIIASVFVLAQQAVGSYGSRAVLILLYDPRTSSLVFRSFTLAIAALLLAGQVPDEGTPPEALTAGVATVTLATAFLLFRAGVVLAGLLGIYTAPRNFAREVVSNVEADLQAGVPGLVVYKVPALGEMIRAGLRRGESIVVSVALEALVDVQEAYLRAVAAGQPRQFASDGQVRETWLAEDLALTLSRAGEESLRLGAAEDDVNAVAITLETVSANAIDAGLSDEAKILMEALARLGVTVHQVTPQVTNLMDKPAPALARLEARAEGIGSAELSSVAIALWATGVAYIENHFEEPHPQFARSIDEFGDAPPWQGAIDLVSSDDFYRRWETKLRYGIEPVIARIQRAAEIRAGNE